MQKGSNAQLSKKRMSKLRMEKSVRRQAKDDARKFQIMYSSLHIDRFGTNPTSWSSKEVGRMKSLIKICHGDAHKAMDLMDYIFKNWTALSVYWKLDSTATLSLSIILSYGKSQIPKVAKDYGWDALSKKQRNRPEEDMPETATATIKMEDDE